MDKGPTEPTAFTTTIRELASDASIRLVEATERVAKNLNANPEKQVRFLREVDYQPASFKASFVFERARQSINALDEYFLKNAKNPASFCEACEQFVQQELYHLFYVTNDAKATQIVRDYMRDFIATSISHFQTDTSLTQDEVDQLHNVVHFLEDGIESYRALRKIVAESSGRKTQSLLALTAQKYAKHRMEPDADAVGIADEYITQKAKEVLKTICGAEEAESKDTAEYIPQHYFLIDRYINAIGQERFMNRHQRPMNLTDNDDFINFTNEIIAVRESVFSALDTGITSQNLQPVLGDLHATLMEASHTPDTMADMLQQAITAAESAVIQTYRTGKKTPMPNSHSKLFFSRTVVVDEHAQKSFESQMKALHKIHQNEELGEWLSDMREQFAECHTLSDIAEAAEDLAAETAGDCLFRGLPSIYGDLAEIYLATLQAHLTRNNIDTRSYTNCAALLTLEQSTSVLSLTRKTVDIANDWLFSDSEGGFTSYYESGVAMASGQSGRLRDHFSPQQYYWAESYAEEQFNATCKTMLEVDEKSPLIKSPFIPYLYELSQELAEERLKHSGLVAAGREGQPLAEVMRRIPPHGPRAPIEKNMLRKVPKQQFINAGIRQEDIRPHAFGVATDPQLHKMTMAILNEALSHLAVKPAKPGKPMVIDLKSVENIGAVAWYLKNLLETTKHRAMGGMTH